VRTKGHVHIGGLEEVRREVYAEEERKGVHLEHYEASLVAVAGEVARCGGFGGTIARDAAHRLVHPHGLRGWWG
jgi:hypothetical protein